MTLQKIFSPTGLLSKHFKGYEYRPQQLQMAKVVQSAIKEKEQVALIEGAPGTGKSFSYLIPIIISGKKAIISTSNKNLQDQLNDKDIKILTAILPHKPFTWQVLKGRNNYLCPQLLMANSKDLKNYLSDFEIQKIKNWRKDTKTGDITYYPDELPYKVKELISCGRFIKHEKGSIADKNCFASKAKRNARKANIIFINHSLLAIDLMFKNKTQNSKGLLPPVDIIVIDEAHKFEEYASLAFTDTINVYSIKHFLSWKIVKDFIDYKDINRIQTNFKRAANKYLPDKNDFYYSQQRVQKFTGFDGVISDLKDIYNYIKFRPLSDNADEKTQVKIWQALAEGKNLIERLDALRHDDIDTVRWTEAKERGKDSNLEVVVTLNSAPLSIANLTTPLFKNKSVILTSATLAVNNNFDFIKETLGIPSHAISLIADSPFNFQEKALLYISKEGDKDYEIEQLLKYSRGRAFVLFTSYKDMIKAYQRVFTPYPKLIQSFDTSRTQLLEKFKNTKNAVLFATKSFWEGVDVQGEQLSLVIIYKIPFGNPYEILYAAKTKRIEKKYGKGKHWIKFTIPQACLSLKQGSGRLIRSKTDRGVIALLDARVNTKNYGKPIVNSLPLAPRTQKLEKVKEFFEKEIQ